MSKTKFIKVSIEEQKPLKSDLYFVIDEGRESTRLFDGKRRRFYGTSQPGIYLQEVPDREEEMRELLEKARTVIARLKRSMLVHPDHEEGSEFDDLTTSAQDMENEIGEYLLNK